MIYFNNAATTFPKPQSVIDAVNKCLQQAPTDQFRNNTETGEIISQCKNNLAKLFHIKTPERIFFTSGATEALNMVIKGLNFSGKHIVTTTTEHNSVLRPLSRFIEAYNSTGNKTITYVDCNSDGFVPVADIEKNIKANTIAVIINHCSNVTGVLQDIEKIGKITRNRGVLFIVDASQSAGSVNIDVEQSNIDLLIFTGHKGLMGIQGIGGFYVRPGIKLRATKLGGTGKDSHIINFPEDYQQYEAGTMNIPGITALNQGIKFILDTNTEKIIAKEKRLTTKLFSELNKLKNVIIYAKSAENHGPALSFNIKGVPPGDVGYILQHSGEYVVRTGLHCAPLIHNALNASEKGTVRVSFSFFNTEKEIDGLVKIIQQINNSR